MQDRIAILSRVQEFRGKVLLIEDKKRAEMNKPFRERDDRLLRFLDREYHVYAFSLAQLEWVLSN